MSLTIRLRWLFVVMGLETDQGRRDEAWLLICKIHADRAVLRAGAR